MSTAYPSHLDLRVPALMYSNLTSLPPYDPRNRWKQIYTQETFCIFRLWSVASFGNVSELSHAGTWVPLLKTPLIHSSSAEVAACQTRFSLTSTQWLHTAEPTTNISIAVNVFFRSLDSAHYATGRDVYGNRDLAAYDKGRKEIGRLVNGFDKVPGPYKQFYLLRLAEELTEMARNPGF